MGTASPACRQAYAPSTDAVNAVEDGGAPDTGANPAFRSGA